VEKDLIAYRLNFVTRMLLKANAVLEDHLQINNPTSKVLPEDVQGFIDHVLTEMLAFASEHLTMRPDEKCETAVLLKTYEPNDACLVREAIGDLSFIPPESRVNLKPSSSAIKDAFYAGRVIIEPSDEDSYIKIYEEQLIDYSKLSKPKSIMIVPIFFNRMRLGVIYLHSSKEDFFSDVRRIQYLVLGDLTGLIFKHDPTWKSKPFD
jgi:hypothetical protein